MPAEQTQTHGGPLLAKILGVVLVEMGERYGCVRLHNGPNGQVEIVGAQVLLTPFGLLSTCEGRGQGETPTRLEQAQTIHVNLHTILNGHLNVLQDSGSISQQARHIGILCSGVIRSGNLENH